MRRLLASCFAWIACLLLMGCSDAAQTETQSPASSTGTIVFGVTSVLRVGLDIDRLHVTVTRDGETLRDDTLTASASGDAKLALPAEIRVDGADGAAIEAAFELFSPGEPAPILTRRAATEVVAGKTLLLRIDLQVECIATLGGGPTGAGECTEPETCIDGECTASLVDSAMLEDYEAGWDEKLVDGCKPANAGPAEVVVGLGQADYAAAEDYDLAQIEAGPQGGHHIWVAVLQKNLLRSGSITRVDGYVPDLDFNVEPFNVIFTFEHGEDGYCELSGLRFQLDLSKDISEYFGKKVHVTVTITDQGKTTGVGDRWFTLSDGTM